MKSINDLFSDNPDGYHKYRPQYPIELIKEIVSMSRERERCWDCGTGNGQVAGILSGFFKTVEATDISRQQLNNAYKSENIRYSLGRAEKSDFPDDHFDLITAAQSAHWFDFPHFFKEITRVARNNGIIALWGYGLLRFENELDIIIDRLYQRLQSDWNEERRHIENKYESIPFPFKNIPLSRSYSIRREFRREELIGYIDTWSAVKNFRKSYNFDPITEFTTQIASVWTRGEKTRSATFPIFTKIGSISKRG